MRPNIKAILLMAGKGERFGSDLPKQFHRLSGKKIYLHTLERFLETELFDEIVLVCCPERLDEVGRDVALYQGTPIRMVAGGKTRQESSFRGLLACGVQTDYVVIHDAVRPFISRSLIEANVAKVIETGAVDTCIPSSDTIVQGKASQILSIPNRSEFFRGQTPQSFSYSLILKAHQQAEEKQIKDVSDDCRLAVEMGRQVAILPGEEINIKITSELDLFLAEQLFRCTRLSLPTTSVNLKGRRFAITGGTGGIGQAIAKALTEQGAHPLMISKSAPVYAADLTLFEQVERVFGAIDREYGPMDGLINSAGLFSRKELQSLEALEIHELIASNLTSLIFSCKSARLKPNGHIINIASSSYSRGRKEQTVYAASKAGVVNFTQGLAEERKDLHINAIVPSRTCTKMRLSHFPDEDPSLLLPPEKVAEAVLELLMQQGLTGGIIEVKQH